MKNKNILIISPSFRKWWWAEKVAADIWNKLHEAWYNVFFLSFQQDHEIQKLKEKLINFNQPKNIFFKILSIFINPFKINKIVKKYNINIIISHTERANFINWFIKKLNPAVKTIWVVHNYEYLNHWFNKFFIKITYPQLDKIVCVSKKIEKELQNKFNLQQTTTIYNWLDFNKIDKLLTQQIPPQDETYFKENEITFINIGRLVKQKGQKYLIQAFSKLQKDYPQTKLIILGEWPLRKELEKLINNLKLKDKVFLLWQKDNVYPYLKNSNCFVFSSLWEWFGLVLVEALYAWLPVISTDCNAWPREILVPDINLDTKLNYNYQTEHWLLVKPIEKLNDIDYLYQWMKDFIKWKLKPNPEVKKYLQSTFDKKIVFEKWLKILESK